MFRATGSVLKFDGFLKVYQEGRDEKTEEDDDEAERTLPLVEKGENLKLNKITPEQHFTEPPPRYSEATLVKALEEKGVGRPSTYAAIMTTIQDREYVEKLDGRFHPTGLGTTVNDLLVAGFNELFDPAYTAKMEEDLDKIEDGKSQLAHGDARILRPFFRESEKRRRIHQRQKENGDSDRRNLRNLRHGNGHQIRTFRTIFSVRKLSRMQNDAGNRQENRRSKRRKRRRRTGGRSCAV